MHFGDFGAAIPLLRAAVESSSKAHDDVTRTFASALLFATAEEMGDPQAAAAAARAYLGDRTTWDPDAPEVDGMALGVIARSRAVSAPDKLAARTQLFEALRAGANPNQPLVPFLVDAASVATPDDARRALATMGDTKLGTLDEPVGSAAVGRTLLLAGRPDDARRYLESAARNCAILGRWAPSVVARVWARADLAEVLAQKGDVAAACAGFREVATQWGDAKPRSVTAERAKARMKALSCPK